MILWMPVIVICLTECFLPTKAFCRCRIWQWPRLECLPIPERSYVLSLKPGTVRVQPNVVMPSHGSGDTASCSGESTRSLWRKTHDERHELPKKLCAPASVSPTQVVKPAKLTWLPPCEALFDPRVRCTPDLSPLSFVRGGLHDADLVPIKRRFRCLFLTTWLAFLTSVSVPRAGCFRLLRGKLLTGTLITICTQQRSLLSPAGFAGELSSDAS